MSYLSKHSHRSAVASIYSWSSRDPFLVPYSIRITALTTGRQVIAFLVLCLVVSFLLFPALSAADERPPESPTSLGLGLGVAPVYRFPAKVTGGGTLETTTVIANAEISRQVQEKLRLGLSFTYEFTDYSFSGLKDFPVARPWEDTQRLGLTLTSIYTLADRWKLIITPTVQFSGELGADFQDALVYGSTVAITYSFRPDSFFGLGLASYYNLEEFVVFPFPVVKWQITRRLRLTNPFRTSPAGPAGLELSYAISDSWSIGFAGAYRTHRFRLDANGPIPNGIGEYKSIPAVVRLSYKPVPAFGIDLYSGASFLNKLYIDDPDGDILYKTRHRITPLIGLAVSGRF